MRSTHLAISCSLAGLATFGLVASAAPVTAQKNRTPHTVELVEPVEQLSSKDLTGYLVFKYRNLFKVDPATASTNESAGQTLSMFGREDLIAANSRDFEPTQCAPLPGKTDVFAEIAARARKTSIVIVNESHERSEHRGFTAEVARRLRALGYDTLAMETLSTFTPGTPADKRPPFVQQPQLPYFSENDGTYLFEAGFGRFGRQAKTLGYRLLAYEASYDPKVAQSQTQDERIAAREEEQASNLAAYLKAHPGTRLLVHVGYSHAQEVPQADGARWMATRLKQKTGIDPLTISQTTCRGGGKTMRLATLPANQPPGIFDLIIDHPTARFERGRPVWRQAIGDRLVAIPPALRPKSGWRVIEARPVGEPATSVPMDRVAIRANEDIALSLPPGRYQLRSIDVVAPPPPPAKPTG